MDRLRRRGFFRSNNTCDDDDDDSDDGDYYNDDNYEGDDDDDDDDVERSDAPVEGRHISSKKSPEKKKVTPLRVSLESPFTPILTKAQR